MPSEEIQLANDVDSGEEEEIHARCIEEGSYEEINEMLSGSQEEKTMETTLVIAEVHKRC